VDQFLSGQAPLMQGLMGNYLEQSKNLFEQMQEQMQKARAVPGHPRLRPP
jgi:polyhydroxyalkanoate synthesis regulator protein